jgi:hypothetical protein
MLFKACSVLFNALPAGAHITVNFKNESVIKIRCVFKKEINVKVMKSEMKKKVHFHLHLLNKTSDFIILNSL